MVDVKTEALKWLVGNDEILSHVTTFLVVLLLLLDKVQNWKGSPEFRAVVQQMKTMNEMIARLAMRR